MYALAAELVVSAKTRNPRGYRHGPYRIWGDLRRCRYFAVSGQPVKPRPHRGLSRIVGQYGTPKAGRGHRSNPMQNEPDLMRDGIELASARTGRP